MNQQTKIAHVTAAFMITTIMGLSVLALIDNSMALICGLKTAAIFGIEATPWKFFPLTLLLIGSAWVFTRSLRIHSRSFFKRRNLLSRFAALFLKILLLIGTGVFLVEDQIAQTHLGETRLSYILANPFSHLIATFLYASAFGFLLLPFRSRIGRWLWALFDQQEPNFLDYYTKRIDKLKTPATKRSYVVAKKALQEFLEGRQFLSFTEIDAAFLYKLERWMKLHKRFPDTMIKACFISYHSIFNYAKEEYGIKTVFPFSKGTTHFI